MAEEEPQSHLWRAAEVVPVGQQIPLERRSLDELRQLRDEKAELCHHLEREMFRLRQPTDLEKRVNFLEGAVEVAERGDEMDPQERMTFLRKFIEDLRDDHHEHLALHDQGQQAEILPHGVVLKVEEHPILKEDRAQAELEEAWRKRPSEHEKHPDIGKPGLFAEQYKLVPNPWNEQGYDYRREAQSRPDWMQAPWEDWQQDLDNMEEMDNRVAQTKFGKIVNNLSEKVWDQVPDVLKPAEAEKPVQYGCGDVFVCRDGARATSRSVRWQMAEAGIAVYGEAPPVTVDWLKENKVIRGEEDDEKEEKEKKQAQRPYVHPAHVMQALYGQYTPPATR